MNRQKIPHIQLVNRYEPPFALTHGVIEGYVDYLRNTVDDKQYRVWFRRLYLKALSGCF